MTSRHILRNSTWKRALMGINRQQHGRKSFHQFTIPLRTTECGSQIYRDSSSCFLQKRWLATIFPRNISKASTSAIPSFHEKRGTSSEYIIHASNNDCHTTENLEIRQDTMVKKAENDITIEELLAKINSRKEDMANEFRKLCKETDKQTDQISSLTSEIQNERSELRSRVKQDLSSEKEQTVKILDASQKLPLSDKTDDQLGITYTQYRLNIMNYVIAVGTFLLSLAAFICKTLKPRKRGALSY